MDMSFVTRFILPVYPEAARSRALSSLRPQRGWRAYVTALSISAAMAFVRALCDPIAGDTSPYIVFYISVGWASVIGGIGPGLFALLLGTVCGTVFWVPPRYSFAIEKSEDVALLVMFVTTAGWMALLGGLARLARIEAEERSAEVASIAQFPLENPNPVFRFSADGEVLFSNPPGQKLAECCLEDIRRVALEMYSAMGAVEKTIRLECGQIFTFSCYSLPERHYINLYGRDVTIQTAAQDELKQRKEEAVSANRSKDDFLAVLSHELRNPLTPVLLAAARLEEESSLPPHLLPLVQLIKRNVALEAHLIEDLLDSTKIARGKLTLDLHLISLHSVIRDALEVCRGDIEEKGIEVNQDLLVGAPIVQGDHSRLQQVVWNLVKNAVKFTPRGGVIEIRTLLEQERVYLEVKDSGVGISAEGIGRIFGAFEQGDSSITRRFGGLGLGLAICRQLLELHGGQISVQSEGEGKGAMFRIELPLLELRRAEEPAMGASPKARSKGEPLRILLVEDHTDTALLMETILSSWGHSIKVAHTAAEAERSANDSPFDLLITDLGLPDKSGLELMHSMKSQLGEIRAIALTGYGRGEDMERTKEAGFVGHLTKPIDIDDLKRVIED